MKLKALALALVLAMAVGMMPVSAAAATRSLPEPVVAPMALPGLTAPAADTYSITLTATGPGKAELYNKTAGARESVYFLADPDPGYKVSFEKCGYHMEQHKMRLLYIGANIYEIIMPDGDVVLDLEFVPITSASHNVKLTVAQGGMATVDQKTAKAGESLFVEVITAPGYSQPQVRARTGDTWLEGYSLGKVDGAVLYEVFMPDGDVEILVEFKRNGPYTVTPCTDTPGGTLVLSHEKAYELETVTVTARPDRGYRVASISGNRSQLTKKSENVWTFPMPKFNEEIHVSFEKIVYPLSVTGETPMGGTAVLDRDSATIGQTVTLTCTPDAGYRVARITGAKVTRQSENIYTFVVEDAAVKLSVLFLREENPFLDVNETHFYYEPVLWARETGITNGVDAEHFGSMGECNRAQVVTFLWRAAGSPVPEAAENPFTDVAEGTWYTDAVLWAVEQGITNGLTADTFGPTRACNRAQVVTFLHRANGSPAPEQAETPFTDVADGSWYEAPVLWALENGVTTGSSGTEFNPAGQCLRAQVVTFLYRAEQIPEPEPEPLLPFPEVG